MTTAERSERTHGAAVKSAFMGNGNVPNVVVLNMPMDMLLQS